MAISITFTNYSATVWNLSLHGSSWDVKHDSSLNWNSSPGPTLDPGSGLQKMEISENSLTGQVASGGFDMYCCWME